MRPSELERLKFLNMEVSVMAEELEVLKEMRDYEALKIDGLPRGNLPSDRVAKIAVKIADLEVRLIEHMEEALEEWGRGIAYIRSIVDPEIRLIIRLRFIVGLTWEEIAARLVVDLSTVKRWYRSWKKEEEEEEGGVQRVNKGGLS